MTIKNIEKREDLKRQNKFLLERIISIGKEHIKGNKVENKNK
jgi:hypothetical protein